MLITRNNYESFFLLYADGELSDREMKTVETFMAANEDLKPELEILYAAVLPAEQIFFGAKDSLLKEMPPHIALKEKLLLAVDNELPRSDDTLFLKDAGVQKEYGLLLLTRSDPSEKIPFPDKSLLYRREKGNKLTGGFIKGFMVAVLLCLGLLLTIFLLKRNGTKKTQEKAIVTSDSALNTAPQNIAANDTVKRDITKLGVKLLSNEVITHAPTPVKKLFGRDSAGVGEIIIKEDNSFPAEIAKDTAGPHGIASAQEKNTAGPGSKPAEEIRDDNKNIKKKKGFFRRLKDFIEVLDDADIIFGKNKKESPPKPPVKTSPITHPPVIEPVKKPDTM